MVLVGDALKKPMRLLTSQRVNLLEVSQEQGKLGDGRLADVNSALEIESRPFGWSSLKQDGSRMVGITFLACPMEKRVMKYGKEDNLIAEKLKTKGKSFLQTKEWKELRRFVIAKYGRKCMKCGTTPKNPKMTHVDHIKCRKTYPELSLDFNNLQVLCCKCNKEKGNKHQTDYRPSTLGELWSKGIEYGQRTGTRIVEPSQARDVCLSRQNQRSTLHNWGLRCSQNRAKILSGTMQ